MKALNRIALRFLIFLALSSGCQNEVISQNCEGDDVVPVEIFYSDKFEDLPCELKNIKNDEKEVTLVITTQADLDKYLTCADQLLIDFNKYFLLAGVYTHHQCAVLNSQQVLICNNTRTIYTMELLEQGCFAVTSVFYATAIERKYLNLPVEFNVEF